MIIELGTVGVDPAADPASCRRPPLPHRTRRTAAAAALTALTIALLGGAALPSPAIALVATIPIGDEDSFSSDGRTVYVQRGPTLSAFALADGRRRRTVSFDETPYVSWEAGAGVMIAMTTGGTAALDPATGAELWRLPGDRADSRDGVLRLVTDAGTDREQNRLVEAATGTVLWSGRPGPPVMATFASSTAAAGADLFVTMAADGATTVRRVRGGAVVATRRIPRAIRAGTETSEAALYADDGVLYLHQLGSTADTFSAYRLPGLEPLWDVSRPDVVSLETCADLICLYGGAGIEALDPRTGASRWHTAEWIGLIDGVGPLLTVFGGGIRQQVALLDAATGRLVVNLGAHPVAFGSANLLVRPDAVAPRRTVVIRPTRGGGRVLGAVDGVTPESCRTDRDYLLCRTADGRTLGIWRLSAVG